MKGREQAQIPRTHSLRSSLGRAAGVFAILMVGLSQGCSPTGPADADGGVTVYELVRFAGQSWRIGSDQRDLDLVMGPCGGDWDDCISSIRVPSGWQATIYEDPDFQGPSLTLSSDVWDLSERGVNGWNTCDGVWGDCISSIRVSQQ